MNHKISELFKDKKKTNLIIIALVVLGGIFMFSSIFEKEESKVKETIDYTQYIASLEEKIEGIASQIIGSTAQANLTLETGTEYVYLDQNTIEEQKNEQSYIVIDDASGGEKALIVTEKMPQIRGVVVVAIGANDLQTEAIKSSVAALLNIRSSKISVIN